MLTLFFSSDIANALVEVGLNTDASGQDWTAYPLPLPSNSGNPTTASDPLTYYLGGTSTTDDLSGVGVPIGISSITVNFTFVAAPPIVTGLSFTVPIKTSKTILSTDVNPLYTLTINSTDPATTPYANNTTNGIIVEFQTPGTYPIQCILTASGTATTTITINFVAYDPTLAIVNQIISYSGQDTYTFSSQILSYSVDGTSYSIPGISSPFVTINNANINAPIITMMGTTASQFHVFLFNVSVAIPDLNNPINTSPKNTVIFNFTYMPIQPVTKTFYIVKPGSTVTTSQATVTLTPSMISDVASGTMYYDVVANNATMVSQGYQITNDAGLPVGFVTSSNTSLGSALPTITLLGNEPGNWDGFNITIVANDSIQETGIPSSLSTIGAATTTIVPVNVVTLALACNGKSSYFYISYQCAIPGQHWIICSGCFKHNCQFHQLDDEWFSSSYVY